MIGKEGKTFFFLLFHFSQKTTRDKSWMGDVGGWRCLCLGLGSVGGKAIEVGMVHGGKKMKQVQDP